MTFDDPEDLEAAYSGVQDCEKCGVTIHALDDDGSGLCERCAGKDSPHIQRQMQSDAFVGTREGSAEK